MDIMVLVTGVVIGLGAAIPSSLLVLVLLNQRDELSPEAAPPERGMQVYIDKAVFVTDVRRLADSGAVMTLADRHALEVRRG